jgi:hypothetical protein
MPAFQMYGKFGANVLGGEAGADVGMMDYITNTWRATLHTTTYAPNIDTNEAFADATNELTTANGYTANGVALANKTVSYNATGNVTTFSADDFSWTASGAGLTFRYTVVHDDTVTVGPPIKPLVGFMDDTGVTLAAGSTYTVDITASGLFTATAI